MPQRRRAAGGFRFPDLPERLAAAGLSPRTVERYTYICRAAELWMEAHGVPLRHAAASDVIAYADSLPLSHASRNQLRAALRWYWRLTNRRTPPLEAIRVPKRQRMICRALEEDEARMLAKAARARRDAKGLVTMFALYAALRRFEIAALRWDQISDGWLHLVGKGDQEAAIPVHPELVAALAEHPRSGPFLFPGRVNGHIHPATVWAWFKRVAEEAGAGDVAPHVGRHTALATAHDASGDLRATMEFARHTRPDVTSGYTRTTARRLVEVVNALDY